MKKEVEVWWSQYFPTDSEVISLPDVNDMVYIMHLISPIVSSHIGFNSNEFEYWDSVKKCIEKISGHKISDPMIDFYGFLSCIFSVSDIINPHTVQASLNYVNKFCLDGNIDFFLTN